MRVLLAASALVVLLSPFASVQAEKRVFIIANKADDYGIDRCLAGGLSCGTAAAAAYCQAREFHQAVSFRKVENDEVTGAPMRTATCRVGACSEYVAIECIR
jgi:uncharacterized DUF497 family protein